MLDDNDERVLSVTERELRAQDDDLVHAFTELQRFDQPGPRVAQATRERRAELRVERHVEGPIEWLVSFLLKLIFVACGIGAVALICLAAQTGDPVTCALTMLVATPLVAILSMAVFALSMPTMD